MDINSVTINEFADNILVDISSSNLIKILFWKAKDFQDYTEATDIVFPTSVNGDYIFTITKEDVGIETFVGLYFLEFTYLEDGLEQTKIAVVANLLPYQECLLNHVISMNIKGCKEEKSNCVECDKDVMRMQIVLSTLYSAIEFGFFEESVRLLEALDESCSTCDNCPDYENNKLINGYGFGTIDNAIILV